MSAREAIPRVSAMLGGIGPRSRPGGDSPLSKERWDFFFDRAASGVTIDVRTPQTERPVWPKLPEGLRSVRMDLARSDADVDRLVPENPNSLSLIRRLKLAIRKHGPVAILTYRDEQGRRFVAIDIYRSPEWLRYMPELEPHERELIRRIRDTRQDIQIVVREAGKTPDLIVDGIVTELKSDFGRYSVDRLVTKANAQVREFKKRHRITRGDLALHLRDYARVPHDEFLRSLREWAGKVRGGVDLDRIWAYAEQDIRIYRWTGSEFTPD